MVRKLTTLIGLQSYSEGNVGATSESRGGQESVSIASRFEANSSGFLSHACRSRRQRSDASFAGATASKTNNQHLQLSSQVWTPAAF